MREPDRLSIEDDVELAAPAAGEVRIRLVATGVCHTDLTVLRGRFPLPLPVVLGHEGAGVVEELGSGVEGLDVGDHVVISIVVSCRNCIQCRCGYPALCETVRPRARAGFMPDGSSRLSRGGETLHHMFCQSSLAEEAVVPASAAVKVRADAPLPQLAGLGCGAMTGIGAVVRKARVAIGDNVLIVGVGGVGLASVLAARAVGAQRIIAADRKQSALIASLDVGATDIIDANVDDIAIKARRIVPRGVDHAIDVVGSSNTITACLDAVRPGGQVTAVGLANSTATAEVPIYALLEEKRITGTRAGSVDPHLVIPWCVELYLAGRLPLDRLVTRTYRLEQLPEVFARMESDHVGRGVVLHDPGGTSEWS